MSKKKIAIIIIMLLMLFSFKITYAQNVEELREEKAKIIESLSKANDDLENIKIELTDSLEALNTLNGKIETEEAKLQTTEKELEELQKEIGDIKEKLDNVTNIFNKQKEICQNRLVALYEMGQTSYLDVLLDSKNITEFISNYYLIGEMAGYDNDLLDNIDREKKIIEKYNTELENKNVSLKTSERNQEKTLIALQNSKTIRNSYINSLTEDEKKLQEQIQEYQNKINTVDSQILFLTIGEISSDYIGGEFLWPSPGYTQITSPFGMRFHPILKYNRMHYGLDIGAPMYSNVVAANSGVVTTASYLFTAGNAVIIDHGGGVSTLYAHGSEILVQVGDIVNRGDLIMKSGTTGLSTGPHLHFAISINGEYVDPMPFLTGNKSE